MFSWKDIFPSYTYSIREDFLSSNMLNYSYNSYGKDYLKNAHEIFLLNPDATPKELL